MYTLREEKRTLEKEDKLIGLDKGGKELKATELEIRKEADKSSTKKQAVYKLKLSDDTVVDELLGSDIEKLADKPDTFYRVYNDNKEFIGYIGVHKKGIIPILIPIILSLIVIILLIFAFIPKTNNDAYVETNDIQAGELTHLTLEEKQELAQKLIDDSMYEIRAQTLPLYKDGKLNICVENSELNKISVKVAILDNTGKEIYYSSKLEPGNFIEWATLSEPIEAGPAQLRFDYLDSNDNVYQSSFVKIDVQIN